MTPNTKCVETIVVTLFAAPIVLSNRKMFFGRDHIGNILKEEPDDSLQRA